MNNKEFKIGDIVRIKKDTEHYIAFSIYNPRDWNGTVVNIVNASNLPKKEYIIRVSWENGRSNIYRLQDLELIKPKLPKTGNETYTLNQIKDVLIKEYDKEDFQDIIKTLEEKL